jgi:hypothetical protein
MALQVTLDKLLEKKPLAKWTRGEREEFLRVLKPLIDYHAKAKALLEK